MKSNRNNNLLNDQEMQTPTQDIQSDDVDRIHAHQASVASSAAAAEVIESAPKQGNPEQDIICGRGLHVMSHNGNLKLHRIVNMHRHTYQCATRREKAALAHRIVEEIKKSGSRFIRKVEGSSSDEDEWEEVDNETAYRKVGHALRLRKNYQPQRKGNKEISSSGTTQAKMPIHESIVDGSSAETTRTALNEVAELSSAVSLHHHTVRVPSYLPSTLVPVQLPMLDALHLQGTIASMSSQSLPYLPLHYPSVMAPSIASRYHYTQLLTPSQLVPLVPGVFDPSLTALTHASMQQAALQQAALQRFRAEQIVRSELAQSDRIFSQESLSDVAEDD